MPNIVKPTGMSVIWADSGTKTPPTALKIAQGWVVELPPYQTANFIENKQDQFNGHVNMHGVPSWDTETEYQGNISYTKGSDGIIYKCIATNTNFDPINPLNSNYWTKAFEDYGTVATVQSQLNTHITNYGTLSALTSVGAARANLSVWSKSESDTRYAALNGSEAQVFSVAVATLGHHAVRLDQVQSLFIQATESVAGVAKIATTLQASTGTDDTTIMTPLKTATVFLRKADNLSTLTNAATARTNLGLGSIAVEAAGNFLRASNNLSDIVNATTARANLGLTTTATQPESYFLRSAQNLLDVPNKPTARTNLGLGNAATLNVGTAAGTVAAGNDTRIVNAVQTSRTLTAGNGLTGGGSLAADRTFTLGTPSTISASSANTVTSTSHSHALDINSFFGERVLGTTGRYTFPGGLLVQWGSEAVAGGGGGAVQSKTVNLGKEYTSAIYSIFLTYQNTTDNDGDSCHARTNGTLDSFFLGNQGRANTVYWITIGV